MRTEQAEQRDHTPAGDLVDLAGRLRSVRLEICGDDGVPLLAWVLGISCEGWADCEAGARVPAEMILRFVAATGARLEWLLTGQGPRYNHDDSWSHWG